MSDEGEFAPTDHDWAVAEAREHLQILREAGYEQKYGWEVDDSELDEKRFLYAIIPTRKADDSLHPDGPYHLRLHFLRYPKRPPILTYVNPDTKSFDATKDARWLPKIAAKPPGVELDYHIDHGGRGQLLCHSMNDDWYYRGGHQANERTAWKLGQHTFIQCLFLHQRLQTEPFYGGKRA